MIYFTDEELDRLLTEDVPYFDMTTRLAKFGSKLAKIQFYTQEPSVICCTEEVIRLFEKLKISPTNITLSGEYLDGNVKFLEAEGLAKHLHTVWRVTANLLEYASGIATQTRFMVEKAQKVNKDIIVTATRKTIPHTRKIAAKAVLVGGGNLNRLSLSENIFFFKNHYSFYGGLQAFIDKIGDIKKDAGGKPISVEASTPSDALQLANAPIDIIQLKDINTQEIAGLIKEIRTKNNSLKIAVAGGINIDNVSKYAKTDADIIVTSFPNHCKPSNFKVEIEPLAEYSLD